MSRSPVTVSQINAYIARLMSGDRVLSNISVTGEISGFKPHSSGHVYFTLKDENSRLNCFLPSSVFRGLNCDISDGMKIIADGYVSIYQRGGSYSLTVRSLSGDGRGDLDAKFEELKARLSAKGYFATERKRPLPAFPLRVGVVTSNTGAAVEDILKIITQRNSVADVVIFPSLVQGENAAESIAARIREACEHEPAIDVLIVGRGGGSKEDLWAFNEEAVADAIFESRIPVISAVGHEIDFTISDFVADVRAETPTAAAKMAVPDTNELSEDIEALLSGISAGAVRALRRDELRLKALDPTGQLAALKTGIEARRERTHGLFGAMSGAVGKRGIDGLKTRTDALADGMRHNILNKLNRLTGRLENGEARLSALSPFSVLERGYTIIEDRDGRVVSSAKLLEKGAEVRAGFKDGSAIAEIREVFVENERQ